MASPNTKRKVSRAYSDLYNTPIEALDALYEVASLDLNKTYFEPCCGKGVISDWFLDKFGKPMVTNELYGYSETHYQEDFLNPKKGVANSWDFDIIVSNPPYKLAKEFILEGFKYSKEQYQLLRINFLESQNRYEDLFKLGHLKNVYLFKGRISCSKGMTEEPQANAVFYAWYHFDRDFVGNPTLHWI